MDACIIVVSLVETGIDVWAQASWNPNMISGKKRKLLRLTWIETRCVESTEAVASDADGSVTNSSQLRLVRSIRLARALRGVRVVRLFRYVSALRTGGGKDRDRI